jgi:single-strand DNA-binding protein
MALCKVMIIGNLGSDPEMRYTPTNRAVTQFNVAVNQSTKNQQTGEWVEETDWFRVSVWGDRAERMAESLRKGNKVFVEGRFKTRTFEGRDGQTRTALEITADSIVNLERRPRDDEGSFGGPSGAGQGGDQGGGYSSGGNRGGGEGGQSGGSPGGNVRPTRPPADDTDLDDLPF